MKKEAKGKVGRPSKYSEELADEICELIATSTIGLNAILKSKEEYPIANTFYKWLNEYPELKDKYAHARARQADILVAEIIEIADDKSHDSINTEHGEIANSEWISRSKVRIDARKWLASKLAPKVYGEKLEVSGGLNIQNNTITLADGTEIKI